jgi:hypothetical protein
LPVEEVGRGGGGGYCEALGDVGVEKAKFVLQVLLQGFAKRMIQAA